MSELLSLLEEVGPAMAVSAVIAAVVLLDLGLPWRAPQPALASIGWALGVGLGFSVGGWLLGQELRWPPHEDRDRFLLVLLPAVTLVEVLTAPPGLPRAAAWLLRLAVAVLAARVLLHDSI